MLISKNQIVFLCLVSLVFSGNFVWSAGFFWNKDNNKEAEAGPKLTEKYAIDLKVYPLEPSHASQGDIDSITGLLQEHLSIINKRTQVDLDLEQERYLVLEASQEIEQILATEGYFDNQVKIIKTDAPQGNHYLLKIGLAKPVKVRHKVVVLTGEIEKDQAISKFYKNVAKVWSLNPPHTFKQSLWNSSKNAALKEVQKEKYPLARIKGSYAQIDTTQHSALLHVDIDSGELVKFGEIKIKVVGKQRYPESIIRNLAGFKQGQEYSEDLLNGYQEELKKDGHYTEVLVGPQLNKIENGEVPIFVLLKEQLKKSFSIELTYDSADGLGAVMGYQHYNFLHKAYVAAVTASLNKYDQEVSLGVTQPKKSSGRFWTARTNYFKGSRHDLDTTLWSTGWWYVYTGKTADTRLGLEYFKERLKPKHERGKTINNDVLLATLQWKINRVRTLLRPENGYYIQAKVGSTLGSLASSGSMQRYEIFADYYITPWQRKNGTFLFKSQLGYVSAKDPGKVPDELRFKVGGPGSVRGYTNDSIGIAKEPYVFGGMAKFAATVEYQKPVTDNVSLAIFHDVGDVKNKFKDMKLKHGTGVGVRWFSIVAPLSADMAYGHQRKKVGWHLNLGTRF